MTTTKKEELPALTGIRFIAALAIALNHLLLGIMPAARFPLLANTFAGCGTLGMNLFFILSGFIIHYNYGYRLSRMSLHELYSFLVARISRLYPLLAAFVCFEVCTQNYILQAKGASFDVYLRALPYYLTFSQSWFYEKLDGPISLTYALHNTSIAWSVSTEFLMYLAYPVLLLLLLQETDRLLARITKAVLGVTSCTMLVRFLLNHQADVDAFGVAHFGPHSGIAYNASHSFAVWLLFLSPYIRIWEFLIGTLACHVFLARREAPPSRWEEHLHRLAAAMSCLFIAATLLPTVYRPTWVTTAYEQTGYLPFIGVIIYNCALYHRSFITRFLSLPALVWAGEASYSFYLLHIVIYNQFAVSIINPWTSVARAVTSIVFVILCSRILFVGFEMPARRWLRRQLEFLPLRQPAR